MALDECDFDMCLEYAKIAEQAERFEDMKEAAKKMTELNPDIFIKKDEETEARGAECRNLLSVAYKNMVGSRRTAVRILTSIEQTKVSFDTKEGAIVCDYKEEVKKELEEGCKEIIGIIDSKFISDKADNENHVFFLKMKGDYYRYMAEIPNDDKDDVIKKSKEAYEKAYNLAKDLTKPSHPIRLGLALNFSVFYYEISGELDKACELAKEAFEAAVNDTDTSDADQRDSSLILQLLRDNLSLWTSDDRDDDDQ